MYRSLDSYINHIIQNTQSQVSGSEHPAKFPPEEEKRGYALLTDEDLDHMIPGYRSDILINAHIPEFDMNSFPHQHTFYELIYVHSGSFRMTINQQNYTLFSGDFILLNPTVIHKVALEEPDSKVINILLKRSLFNNSFFHMILDNQLFADFILPSLAKQKKEKNYMIYRNAATDNPILLNYLLNLLKEYEEYQTLSSSAMEINLSGLCIELARSYRKPAVQSREKKQDFSIADIFQYLTANLRTATLEQTAAYFHYNPKYFSNLLKKIYGKSFSGLLLDLRMAYAAKLLKQTSIPIIDVIHQSGYENTSHFYHVFEKTYGMSPSQYREHYSGSL